MSETHFILIFHGSASPEAQEVCLELVDSLKNRLSKSFSFCYLRSGIPDLSKALELAFEKGYRDITCMPMLLLPGAHSIKEIPETIESFKNIHSDCAITLLPCLAKNHDFVAFLAKLMEKCHG